MTSMRSGPEQPRRSAPVASGDNIGAILKNSPLNGLETRILQTHAGGVHLGLGTNVLG